jgi:NADP-dependent 3-hydroxy acid dehydrogenase YdfG
VTGASGVLGGAIARGLAAASARVARVGHRRGPLEDLAAIRPIQSVARMARFAVRLGLGSVAFVYRTKRLQRAGFDGT